MSEPAQAWGEAEGRTIERFTLRGDGGLFVRVASWGATLTALHAPDRDGRLADVVLGFDTLDGYLGEHPYFGGVVGRCANRIAGGRFTLDGVEHALACNDGAHHLHGGPRGFDRRVWDAEPLGAAAVRFTRTSPAGEEGYPGTVRARVTYAVEGHALSVTFEGTSDAPTLFNLAQHAYWNLAGHDAGPVADHELAVRASRYVPVGDDLIPRGDLADVSGTPFDLTTPVRLGDRLRLPLAGELGAPGFDHDLVVDGAPGELRPVAELRHPASGRTLAVSSDQPGVQLYTGNGLDGSVRGKGGVAYVRHGGLCLETQAHPDAIHWPHGPAPVLRPGERSVHRMVLRFGVDGSGPSP